MDSLQVREFKNAIINFTNKSNLPLEVKRLCFAEVLAEVQSAAEEEIRKEILIRNAEEKLGSEVEEDAESV